MEDAEATNMVVVRLLFPIILLAKDLAATDDDDDISMIAMKSTNVTQEEKEEWKDRCIQGND